MKIKISFLLIVALLLLCCKKTNESMGGVAQVQQVNKKFSFGTITNKDTITHVFKVRNISEFAYKIDTVAASCGCASIEYSRSKFFKKQVAEIKVVYIPDPSDEGTIVKTVVVSGNNTEGFLTFYLTGEVVPSL